MKSNTIENIRSGFLHDKKLELVEDFRNFFILFVNKFNGFCINNFFQINQKKKHIYSNNYNFVYKKLDSAAFRNILIL